MEKKKEQKLTSKQKMQREKREKNKALDEIAKEAMKKEIAENERLANLVKQRKEQQIKFNEEIKKRDKDKKQNSDTNSKKRSNDDVNTETYKKYKRINNYNSDREPSLSEKYKFIRELDNGEYIRHPDIVAEIMKRNYNRDSSLSKFMEESTGFNDIKGYGDFLLKASPAEINYLIFGRRNTIDVFNKKGIRSKIETITAYDQCRNVIGEPRDSMTCWICGCTFNRNIENMNPTCEHIFPILRSVMFAGIDTLVNLKDAHIELLNELMKTNYTWTHHSCNQLKNETMYVSFNEKDFKFKIDIETLKDAMKKIKICGNLSDLCEKIKNDVNFLISHMNLELNAIKDLFSPNIRMKRVFEMYMMYLFLVINKYNNTQINDNVHSYIKDNDKKVRANMHPRFQKLLRSQSSSAIYRQNQSPPSGRPFQQQQQRSSLSAAPFQTGQPFQQEHSSSSAYMQAPFQTGQPFQQQQRSSSSAAPFQTGQPFQQQRSSSSAAPFQTGQPFQQHPSPSQPRQSNFNRFGNVELDRRINLLRQQITQERNILETETLKNSQELHQYVTDYLTPQLQLYTQDQNTIQNLNDLMSRFINEIQNLPHCDKNFTPFFKDNTSYFSMFGFTHGFIMAIIQLVIGFKFNIKTCELYIIFLHKYRNTYRSTETENIEMLQTDQLFLKYKELFHTIFGIDLSHHLCEKQDFLDYLQKMSMY